MSIFNLVQRETKSGEKEFWHSKRTPLLSESLFYKIWEKHIGNQFRRIWEDKRRKKNILLSKKHCCLSLLVSANFITDAHVKCVIRTRNTYNVFIMAKIVNQLWDVNIFPWQMDPPRFFLCFFKISLEVLWWFSYSNSWHST